MTASLYTDYFGGCPICWENDGYLNVSREHIFICREHKTAWNVGSNLFSCWREENEAIWRYNVELLENFKEVEPAVCLQPEFGGYVNDIALKREGVAEAHAAAMAEYAIKKASEPRQPDDWAEQEIPF